MAASVSMISIIQQRYSCRNYASKPLSDETQHAVINYLSQLPAGPFHKLNRFEVIASTDQDRSILRGLGTYGFIKNPSAFIIGASEEGPLTLEDFGYRLEQIILQMTRLGLGTCWLGGTFNRSAFAHKISASNFEILPAVCSLGYPAQDEHQAGNIVQALSHSKDRLAWDALFFDDQFGSPLSPTTIGPYTTLLEMVQLAPSASNKQPWRILRRGKYWHLYLQRTKGYREMALGRFTGIADMQRIDMGIAMCHFELAARDCGLSGYWHISEPDVEKPDSQTHYVVTWVSDPL